MFQLNNEFEFTIDLFVEALELEAYEISALLFKEFYRKIRDPTKKNEYIKTILISSLNKNNGQIDYKTFLIRCYIETFELRHAKHFVDILDSKIQQENKYNILVLNFNVAKTSCLLIELLEIVANRFEQLRVRCNTLRHKIEELTKLYMAKVETE